MSCSELSNASMRPVCHNIVLTILSLGIKWGKSPRLKKWLELESYKDKIIKATDGGDLPKVLLKYLSVALGVSDKYFYRADWVLLVKVFYLTLEKSPKVDLPITSPTTETSKDDEWSYDGRIWHLYSHMLAKSYGWDLEYISCLHVDEALAKIQEIVVDDQLEKEFYYGLSEIAYSYDSRSKTSKFKPLPRPHWMRPKAKPIKKFLIPKDMLPVGVVNLTDALPEEYLPKEVKTK